MLPLFIHHCRWYLYQTHELSYTSLCIKQALKASPNHILCYWNPAQIIWILVIIPSISWFASVLVPLEWALMDPFSLPCTWGSTRILFFFATFSEWLFLGNIRQNFKKCSSWNYSKVVYEQLHSLKKIEIKLLILIVNFADDQLYGLLFFFSQSNLHSVHLWSQELAMTQKWLSITHMWETTSIRLDGDFMKWNSKFHLTEKSKIFFTDVASFTMHSSIGNIKVINDINITKFSIMINISRFNWH